MFASNEKSLKRAESKKITPEAFIQAQFRNNILRPLRLRTDFYLVESPMNKIQLQQKQ